MKKEFKLITKYTKAIMKRCYGVEVDVYFKKSRAYVGVFTKEDESPHCVEGYNKFKANGSKGNCSITYSSLIFKNSITDYHFRYLVHEVTHLKTGCIYNPKTKRMSHPKDFWQEYSKNCRMVKDIEKEFIKEIEK